MLRQVLELTWRSMGLNAYERCLAWWSVQDYPLNAVDLAQKGYNNVRKGNKDE